MYRFIPFIFFLYHVPVHPFRRKVFLHQHLSKTQTTYHKKNIQSEGGVVLANGVFIRFTDFFLVVFFLVYLLPVYPFRLKGALCA